MDEIVKEPTEQTAPKPRASTRSKATKTTSTKAEATATEVVEAAEPVVEEKVVYKVKQNFDPSMYVTVKNGFNGTLVYKSKKTGERFVWPSFGDEQDMELSELRTARTSSKAFFINNWFLFDDPAIVDWLGMSQYYKHALNSDNFDDLFSSSPEEIEQTVSELSAGQRKSVIFRARQMISDGKIDSIKVINALEKSLGTELIER